MNVDIMFLKKKILYLKDELIGSISVLKEMKEKRENMEINFYSYTFVHGFNIA